MTDTQIFEPDERAIPFAVDGDGPVLVLIAGAGLGIDYLGALAHSVSTADFRVIRIDPRGAAGPHAPRAAAELAQDVVDVLDHLAVDHAWVGGHAAGGSLARAVSHAHPDRVNGVLLLGVEGDAAAGALAPGIPVLVVQGSVDDVTPPANGEQLRAAAPDRVSVVEIEGGGHLFPQTHVGATSWAIEDYLDWD